MLLGATGQHAPVSAGTAAVPSRCIGGLRLGAQAGFPPGMHQADVGAAVAAAVVVVVEVAVVGGGRRVLCHCLASAPLGVAYQGHFDGGPRLCWPALQLLGTLLPSMQHLGAWRSCQLQGQ